VSDWVESFGLAALFLILALQAAGVPGPPGKTALVIASLLAADGRLVLWQVLVIAALGVAVGGFAGYAIGRLGGRRLLDRLWPEGKLVRLVSATERFFKRHGAKSVVLARFVPGFKVAIAPAAGMARMRFAQFVLWHVLAAVAFALAFGLLGYFAGAAVVNAVERFGVYAAAVLAILALGAAAAYWRLRRGSSPLPG
jgi:membrane protein DedA with SNARE-associated domain